MKLPAGLEDGNLEIYRFEKKAHALYHGCKNNYLDLPLEVREFFQVELIKDTKANECLEHVFGLTEPDEKEEKFVWCRFGSLDGTPDLAEGKITPDVPNCKYERNCEGCGIICLLPLGPGGKLSKQEYIVTRLVTKGLLDKEIAQELTIEINTVTTYMARIRKKLSINNRAEIANWARTKGID